MEPVTVDPGNDRASKAPRRCNIDVRVTRHGPLVSDAINANNAASRGIEAGAARAARVPMDGARRRGLHAASFLRAQRGAQLGPSSRLRCATFVVPSQNFVYADVDGHIGYYAPGHIPIRASGDGSSPAEGWTGEAEWTGWIPFDELPHLYDPPDHFIVTANHRPAPAGYPLSPRARMAGAVSRRSASGSFSGWLRRGERRADRIHAGRFRAIPGRHDLAARKDARCRCCSRTRDPTPRRIGRRVEMLRRWNFDASGDSAAAAIFEAWFLQLAPTIVGDELGLR